MKYRILITIISALLIISCHADLADIAKDTAIRQIIYKICNITMGPMRNAPPPEKAAMFKSLELKLRKATKALNKSDQDKNIKFIMEGVKEMSLNNDYKLCAHGLPPIYNKTISIVENITTTEKLNTSIIIERRNLQPIDKYNHVKKMVEKLTMLAKNKFKNGTTLEEKKIILNQIRQKVDGALKRRHLDRDEKNNSYSDLIMEGLEAMVLKDVAPRRMALELVGNDPSSQLYTTPAPPMGLTTEASCDYQLSGVCSSLKLLNEVKCQYDDTTLSLDKICDGAIDCPDGSDEQYCAKQAIQRVHRATDIMARIDLSRKCFTTITRSLISQQNRMLTELLQTEINFIKKYANLKKLQGETIKVNDFDVRTVTQITNEVSVLLKTFVMALTGAFCVHAKEEFDQMIHRLGESIEKDLENPQMPNVPKYSLKHCDCKGQFCVDPVCKTACKRICFQKYTLVRWNCNAISGGSSVPLDFICDGKLDCYDETDETGCNNQNSGAKFQSSSIFMEILEDLKTKTTAYTAVPLRNKLVSLHDAIGTLQKRSMQPVIKPVVYKSLRDRCFGLMTAFYDLVLTTEEYVNTAEDVYDFLLTVNDRLVHALKRSHTGNKKVITPDGCFCRGSICAVPKCSKKCTRTCAAKPFLKNYFCSSPKSNGTYIPIEQICNGKANCPDGEDEKHCKEDFCRAHHLYVLRNHLQKVGEKQKGTVLGEVLKSWKVKVTSTLKIAEKRERPTQRDFKEIVADILDDLVQTYSLLDDYRRTNTDVVLKKFEKLAQHILETLKSCGM